jgi:hypothetical protein
MGKALRGWLGNTCALCKGRIDAEACNNLVQLFPECCRNLETGVIMHVDGVKPYCFVGNARLSCVVHKDLDWLLPTLSKADAPFIEMIEGEGFGKYTYVDRWNASMPFKALIRRIVIVTITPCSNRQE